jgi:hypothetical protein
MKSINQLVREWLLALQTEIHFLQKYGSNKYMINNGQLLSSENSFLYYFDSFQSINIPIGSQIRIEWGNRMVKGKIRSAEGKSVILSLDRNIGDMVSEVFLFHDPWELLDQLMVRLVDLKKSKIKRSRIKQLMFPSNQKKHPMDNIKSKVHELMLRSQYNPVTFVWGPPGTGKTYTLARVAAHKYFNGRKVLILAHSNQAVDVLLAEVSYYLQQKGKFKEGEIVRYGSQSNDQLFQHPVSTIQLIQTFHPELAEQKKRLVGEREAIKQDLTRSFSHRDSNYLLELEGKIAGILDKFRQKEVEYLKDARIIGVTLAKAASDENIYENNYDLVIVDEVSQAYIPQLAFAASLAKRIIICGDFKQLPPIASSKAPIVQEWLREDIFLKAGVTDTIKSGELHPQLLLLNEQRRMHPDISAFTNKHIYQSLITDHPSLLSSRQPIIERIPFQKRASVLLDVSFIGENCLKDRISHSRINLWQLLISLQVIYESIEGGAKSIGYVTPYRAQSELMANLLAEFFTLERNEVDIIAATVHRFQGSERDVMIFDTVDSFPMERPGMLLFGEESERLINVAITRTRGKFIHISDTHFLQSKIKSGKTIRQLLEFQNQNQQVIDFQKVGSWIKHQHPRLKWIHARNLMPISNDIQRARRSIILCMPKTEKLPSEWQHILTNRQNKVPLIFISPELNASIQVDRWVTKPFPFPFVLIDQRILWLGVPLEGANRIKPPYVAVRLESDAIGHFIFKQVQN